MWCTGLQGGGLRECWAGRVGYLDFGTRSRICGGVFILGEETGPPDSRLRGFLGLQSGFLVLS